MAGSCVGMRRSTSHAKCRESLLQAPLKGGLVIGAQCWHLSLCCTYSTPSLTWPAVSCHPTPYTGSGPGAPEEAARLLSQLPSAFLLRRHRGSWREAGHFNFDDSAPPAYSSSATVAESRGRRGGPESQPAPQKGCGSHL